MNQDQLYNISCGKDVVSVAVAQWPQKLGIVPPFFSSSGFRDTGIRSKKYHPACDSPYETAPVSRRTVACAKFDPDIAAAIQSSSLIDGYGRRFRSFVWLNKPLSSCRVTLISTSGCYVKGDLSYFYQDDDSYRKIPSDTSASDLRFSHLTENFLTDARRDPNCVFPIDTLRSAVNDNVIGSTTENYFSVMGACYNVKKVVENLIPKLKKAVFGENPDLCLLVAM